jgi:hypothetical protein
VTVDNFQSRVRNASGVAFRNVDAFLVERAHPWVRRRHGEYRRVGFAHVRKSGGTSVVNAVSRSICGSDAMIVHADLAFRHVAKSGSRTIVGWHDQRLRRGLFDFGYSHSPWHKTFHSESINSFTVVRDPVDRAISLWKMYHGGSSRNQLRRRWKAQHSGEARWGVGPFRDFISRLPFSRANELTFSFSADGSAKSAYENICSSNVRVFFLSDLQALEVWLSQALELEISIQHEHAALISPPELSDEDMGNLTRLLASDLMLMRMLQADT